MYKKLGEEKEWDKRNSNRSNGQGGGRTEAYGEKREGGYMAGPYSEERV